MSADEADLAFEIVFAREGGIAYLRAVIIDGIGRVVQQLRYLGTGINTEPHERKDTQFGGEHIPLLGRDARFGREQGIEIIDKSRVERQEGLVKIAIESGHLLPQKRLRVLLRLARHPLHTVDHIAIDLQVAAYILLLDHIAFFQLAVEHAQLAVQGT